MTSSFRTFTDFLLSAVYAVCTRSAVQRGGKTPCPHRACNLGRKRRKKERKKCVVKTCKDCVVTKQIRKSSERIRKGQQGKSSMGCDMWAETRKMEMGVHSKSIEISDQGSSTHVPRPEVSDLGVYGRPRVYVFRCL